jgi:hypothetical protein
MPVATYILPANAGVKVQRRGNTRAQINIKSACLKKVLTNTTSQYAQSTCTIKHTSSRLINHSRYKNALRVHTIQAISDMPIKSYHTSYHRIVVVDKSIEIKTNRIYPFDNPRRLNLKGKGQKL